MKCDGPQGMVQKMQAHKRGKERFKFFWTVQERRHTALGKAKGTRECVKRATGDGRPSKQAEGLRWTVAISGAVWELEK